MVTSNLCKQSHDTLSDFYIYTIRNNFPTFFSQITMSDLSVDVVKKWKRADVLKYLKFKQNDLDLDDEDIMIIEKNKVAGQVFITLTEEKLLAPSYNLLGGPAEAIALLIKALNGKVQGKCTTSF